MNSASLFLEGTIDYVQECLTTPAVLCAHESFSFQQNPLYALVISESDFGGVELV